MPELVQLLSTVMERMRKLRSQISLNDSTQRFRDMGIDVYFGQGRFLDSSTIEVDGTKLNFKRAVIATGGRAAAPPIPGFAHMVDRCPKPTLDPVRTGDRHCFTDPR